MSFTVPSRHSRTATAGLEVFDTMLKRILVGVVFIPIVFVVLFVLPPIWTAIMVAFIGALASYELLRATGVAHHNRTYLYTSLCAALIPFGIYLTGSGWQVSYAVPVALCMVLLMCALFMQAIIHFGGEDSIPMEHVMVGLFAGAIIPAFLSCLLQLRMMENGKFLVLLPIISAFLTDSGAYFVGMFFGKHRGVTKVSPNKSLEGYIGGIVAGALFMLLYGVVLEKVVGIIPSYPVMAVYGLVGSAVTELGDLSFSLIKRQFGVKDYGNLLPGHGGMMDRFDSMVFAAPAIWVMVSMFPAF